MASGRRVAGTTRSLVNARGLQLECVKVLQETLLVSILIYGRETMLWKEKEISSIRVVHMDNLRGLLGIRRMNKVPNARIRDLCGVTKGIDERIDEGVLRQFGHVERMENDAIAKEGYVGECAGSRSVGRKRWIATVKNCLRKRSLGVRKARRMVQDRREWEGFVRGNAWVVTRG